MTKLSEQQSIAKIGIDTGTKTGFAVWEDGKLQVVESMTITQAMRKILTVLIHAKQPSSTLRMQGYGLASTAKPNSQKRSVKVQVASSVMQRFGKIGAKSMAMRCYLLNQWVRASRSQQKTLNVLQVGQVEQMSMQGMQP